MALSLSDKYISTHQAFSAPEKRSAGTQLTTQKRHSAARSSTVRFRPEAEVDRLEKRTLNVELTGA